MADEYTLPDSGSSLEGTSDAPQPIQPADDKPPLRNRLFASRRTILVVVLAVILFLLLVGVTIIIVVKKEVKKEKPTPVTINTQTLDNGTLNKLTAQAGPADQTKQQLTISPDTLFKNTVEVQGTLKTDKDLEVGGTLTVHGNTTLQGAVGINSNLSVKGSMSVAGTLSAPALNVGTLGVTNLNLAGNLNFGGHLVPSGSRPAIKTSVAASGGTVTIDGNDTAGTITINIGSGGVIAGEMAIITFNKPFSLTPKVQLTPINSAASSLNYYATRTASFFTVDTSSIPANGASYVFDYLVTQ